MFTTVFFKLGWISSHSRGLPLEQYKARGRPAARCGYSCRAQFQCRFVVSTVATANKNRIVGVNESAGRALLAWGWRGADNPHRRLVAVRLANPEGLQGVGSSRLYERRPNRLDSLDPDSDVTQVRLGRAKITRPRTRRRMQAGAARWVVDCNLDERRGRG